MVGTTEGQNLPAPRLQLSFLLREILPYESVTLLPE